ncbi:MAG: hypothetical protein DWQ19_12525 [Crenarchaeota archaeon]|nr:MAG: hypothetical protein DWQ19_12525 [Thermoproteota archaeon]
MTIPYTKYLEIKDKYCIAYYGVFNEFIWQLNYLRPAIEKELPGVQLYISCKDELKEINSERIVPQSHFNKHNFAYVRKLNFNNISHPIEDLLEESNITLKYLNLPQPTSQNKRCVLLTNGLGGVRSLPQDKQREVIKHIEKMGYFIENSNVEEAGWVVGVECESFYKAAIAGIKVTLLPTGFGTKFFQKLFPQGEIYKL